MARKPTTGPVRMAFEEEGLIIPIADLLPLRQVGNAVKKSMKYQRIAASIREVGLVEPPVVARDRGSPGKFLLLDGHFRVEVLKDLNETSVVCLVSRDDEAFTYNKRISRLAIVQEHRMILKAVERGVSEERIAKALNIDVHTLRQKQRMLNGLCAEAVDLLKDKHVPENAFWSSWSKPRSGRRSRDFPTIKLR